MNAPPEPNRLTLPVGDRDHCQGNPAAEMTLVEYGDYQCSACQAIYPIIQVLQLQWGHRLRYVFRHFPQPHLYPDTHHAAEAAEAAASQNKFWEMHACLFEHPLHLADSDLVEYAIALFLDVNLFLHDLATERHIAKVQADFESGLASGVTKTPAFFINGWKHNDDRSLETLLEAASNSNFE
ncbi:disulfide bond formation protein DsbA [filamentous cyanobacterium CCT1]|nr:disulfide bond formation protein DsbA [filamentous cyanobacterium CCT1]PSN75938.1 disulfide bond formation protein DsbA [filamentous cyanobacterium CCP4]